MGRSVRTAFARCCTSRAWRNCRLSSRSPEPATAPTRSRSPSSAASPLTNEAWAAVAVLTNGRGSPPWWPHRSAPEPDPSRQLLDRPEGGVRLPGGHQTPVLHLALHVLQAPPGLVLVHELVHSGSSVTIVSNLLVIITHVRGL